MFTWRSTSNRLATSSSRCWATSYGKVVHFGERECTIQRRHQKLVEESPSTQLDQETRERVGSQVVEALQKIGYTSAGTVEFLMDENRKLHFLEMNTRIQVEHAVTEMVTGVDLVKMQIHIAAGGHLDFGGEVDALARTCHRVPDLRRKPGKLCSFRRQGDGLSRSRGASASEWILPPTPNP